MTWTAFCGRNDAKQAFKIPMHVYRASKLYKTFFFAFNQNSMEYLQIFDKEQYYRNIQKLPGILGPETHHPGRHCYIPFYRHTEETTV